MAGASLAGDLIRLPQRFIELGAVAQDAMRYAFARLPERAQLFRHPHFQAQTLAYHGRRKTEHVHVVDEAAFHVPRPESHQCAQHDIIFEYGHGEKGDALRGQGVARRAETQRGRFLIDVRDQLHLARGQHLSDEGIAAHGPFQHLGTRRVQAIPLFLESLPPAGNDDPPADEMQAVGKHGQDSLDDDFGLTLLFHQLRDLQQQENLILPLQFQHRVADIGIRSATPFFG